MSQMTSSARAGARPLNRPNTAPPGLRVVTGARPRRGGAAFGVICAMLLATGLIALLLLNTALGQGSFTLHDLRATSDRLTDSQEALTISLESSKSPAHLAARAAAMGMVPAQSVAFLRLSDGKLIGVAHPAVAGPAFTVVRTPTAPVSTRVPAAAAPRVPATTAPATTTPAKRAPAKPAKPAKPATR